MIDPVGYEVRCDAAGCDQVKQHSNLFRLYDLMDAVGWQRGVKLDGQPAKRGGKDYCPEHWRAPTGDMGGPRGACVPSGPMGRGHALPTARAQTLGSRWGG